jgi:hypothetical protein
MPDEITTRFHEASVPPMSIDPDAVVAGGRRRRRRRSLAAVAATAAAVTVLGIGGWAVLSDHTSDDRTLPAVTPSPTVGRTAAEQAATALPLGAVPPTGRTMPVVARFRFDESASRIWFSLEAEDGTVLADHPVSESETGRPRWSTMVPGLTLAVLPAGTTTAIPIWGGSTTAAGSATAEAPDGRVLMAWWTDGSDSEPFLGLTWARGDTVFRADGVPLGSSRVGDVLFHFDDDQSVLGYTAPATEDDPLGTGRTRFADEVEPGTFLSVWAPGPEGQGLYAVLLPPARDVELVTTDKGTVRSLDTTDLGGNAGMLVVARVDGPADSVTGVRFTSSGRGTTGGPAPAE